MTEPFDELMDWQFVVVTFGTTSASGHTFDTDYSADLTIRQIRDLLAREGLSEQAVQEVESYDDLSDLMGETFVDEPQFKVSESLPQDVVLDQGPPLLAEAFQFIVDNREWVALTMLSGVVGNRTDAAVTGIFRKLRRNRTIQQLPELSRETAWVSACHALRRSYRLPRYSRFVAIQEQQEVDGAWSFTSRCWQTTGAEDTDYDGWLYSANVRPPANVGAKGKGQFNITRVGRRRSTE